MSTATDAIIARIIDNRVRKNTPKVVRDVLTDLVEEMLPLTDDILKARYTRGTIRNTFKTNGAIALPILAAGLPGLIPPDSPQPETGGDYNGFIKVTGLQAEQARGFLKNNVTNDSVECVTGGAGDYEIGHAWVNASSDTANTSMAFTIAVLRSGFLQFAGRVVSARIPNQGTLANLSGGGFLTDMQEGDELQIWVAADRLCTLSINDLNVELLMYMTDTTKAYTAALFPPP